jgi:pimeloyl-ACP methyl ester carboxylesterase
MVAEVVQVLKQENIKGANFIGWSLGGNIAYSIAAEAPELVASIASIASPPVKISDDGLRYGLSEWLFTNIVPQWVNHPAPTGPEEAAGLRGFMGFDETDTFFVEDMMSTDPLIRRHLFLNAEYNSPAYDNSVLDGEHFVRSTKMPLCLLAGDKDSGVNYQLIASFSTALQNEHSKVHLIPGAPHAVFKTHPAEYYKIVDAFFDGELAPTAMAAPAAAPIATLLSDAQHHTIFGSSALSSLGTDAARPGMGGATS